MEHTHEIKRRIYGMIQAIGVTIIILTRVCSLNCVNDLFIILGNDPQIGLQID